MFFNNSEDTLKKTFSKYQTNRDASLKGDGLLFLKKGVQPNCINASLISEGLLETILFFKSSIIPRTLLG